MIKSESLKQLFKFGLVGCLNTAIDWGVYYAIITLVSPEIPFFYTAVKAFSFFCGMVNSFFLNRSWTFRIRGGSSEKSRFIKFTMVNLLVLSINAVSFTVFLNMGFTHFLSLFLATAFAFIFNFILSKVWVFRKGKSHADTTESGS